ncbi:MAG: AbrB/MazE/SpoVT family DNA-binding domain-containing protein [Verrucomicrobiaceae bacterium]|nr:AbrB/MazE/SpoVT family DNA-binding domain-containing protein [Verrucomicrobiaceae bacterium]
MSLELKLRKIGNSIGIILPKEALRHLKIEEGDTVALTETPDGYRMSQSQSDFARTMGVSSPNEGTGLADTRGMSLAAC